MKNKKFLPLVILITVAISLIFFVTNVKTLKRGEYAIKQSISGSITVIEGCGQLLFSPHTKNYYWDRFVSINVSDTLSNVILNYSVRFDLDLNNVEKAFILYGTQEKLKEFLTKQINYSLINEEVKQRTVKEYVGVNLLFENKLSTVDMSHIIDSVINEFNINLQMQEVIKYNSSEIIHVKPLMF